MHEFRRSLLLVAEEKNADILVITDRSKLRKATSDPSHDIALKWGTRRIWLLIDKPSTQSESSPDDLEQLREKLDGRLIEVGVAKHERKDPVTRPRAS